MNEPTQLGPIVEPTTPSPAAATECAPPQHSENSAEATRGEPLAVRAQKRKLELEAALTKLGTGEPRARTDIDHAVASIDALLTGDVEHLSGTTAAELSRLLESSKHIAEHAESGAPAAQQENLPVTWSREHFHATFENASV